MKEQTKERTGRDLRDQPVQEWKTQTPAWAYHVKSEIWTLKKKLFAETNPSGSQLGMRALTQSLWRKLSSEPLSDTREISQPLTESWDRGDG